MDQAQREENGRDREDQAGLSAIASSVVSELRPINSGWTGRGKMVPSVWRTIQEAKGSSRSMESGCSPRPEGCALDDFTFCTVLDRLFFSILFFFSWNSRTELFLFFLFLFLIFCQSTKKFIIKIKIYTKEKNKTWTCIPSNSLLLLTISIFTT